MIYAPLKHIEDMHAENVYDTLISHGYKKELTPESFYKSSFSKDLWDGRSDGFKQIMEKTIRYFRDPKIRARVNREMPDMDTSEWDDVDDNMIYALVQKYAVLDRWAESKQIYEFDPDFAEALIDTKELKIYPEIVSHLPYDTFYMDLRKIPLIKDMGEIYAHVHFFPDGQGVLYYITFPPDDKGGLSRYCTLTDDEKITDEHGYTYYLADKALFKKEMGSKEAADTEIFLWQAINFLASEKPDIEENEITKKTYRPSTRIKNKFSEIRQWDVGFRYGSAIRAEKKSASVDEADDNEATATINHRRSPRPHTRCAHWQTVWTGKGRMIPKQRWFRQTFVGAGKITAVAHKVKSDAKRIEDGNKDASEQ